MNVFEKRPELAAEWVDPRDPQTVSAGSNYAAAWRCAKGHDWKANVKNRVNGAGCPVCTNRKIVPGINDLATTHPHIAKEFHPELNTRSSTSLSAGSKESVWWVADCGHEWKQSVGKRTARGDGCPYCAPAGTKLLPGFNDLATRFPEVAAEWHPENELTAAEVFPMSGKTYRWRGGCGHEWECSIANRTHNKSGCPYCAANPKVLAGFNDLATLNPKIAAQWHPTKNSKAPSEVVTGTPQRFWWKCDKGHEWISEVNSRARGNTGCPFCSKRRAYPGESDLGTLRPEIAEQWSGRNGLTPRDVTQNSPRRVWWECGKGHEWRASVNDRTRADGRHTGCPTCAASTYVSRAESELADYVGSLTEIETSYRGLSGVHEVDIAVPSKRIAIEFNGLYWHNENVRGGDYHQIKTEAVEAQGWSLIHVWEDDWNGRKDVVKRMVARKLGLSRETRTNARDMTVAVITAAQARSFLEQNHVQGSSSGSVRMGLFSGTDLKAVLIMKRRTEEEWELVRFATSEIVRGGFSRLFKAALSASGASRVVTFADRAVSDGGLYRATGFKEDGVIPADYMYVVRGRREHKFNYRKARFESDPNLKYEEGLTERQLAELNKLPRIWDAGKVRWVLHCD